MRRKRNRSGQTIGSGQLAALYVSFGLGSSIIYLPQVMIGFAANAAWLAVGFSTIWGMLVLACILYLSDRFPGRTFIEYSGAVFGRWVGAAVGALTVFMLVTMLVYIVISIGGFFTASMMNETPPYVFDGLTLLLAALTVYAGIEVMARMFMILLAMLLFSVYIVYVLSVPHFHPELLLPLFPDGWKPLLHGVYYAAGFPYSEVALFAALLAFVRRERGKSKAAKPLYAALAWVGVTLMLSMIVPVAVMGPLAGEREYSLYSIAQVISIYEIVERIESIIGIALIVGSYMKATVVLFVLNLSVSQLFRLADERIVVFPLTAFCFLLSATMYPNDMSYADAVSRIWPLMAITLGALPVLAAALAAWLRGGPKPMSGRGEM